MKILLITQKVDLQDDNLGFFHRWIEEFAQNADKIFVITQFAGEYHLPENVEIYSMGKEGGLGRMRRYFNFYKYTLHIMPRADAVFVHMIPLWVLLLWWPALVLRKKMYLWYTHKSVTWTLRLAAKMVVKIFTASPESCRLRSNKLEVVGHGIDTDYFIPKPELQSYTVYRIISVGRISASKRIKDMILAAAELRALLPPERKFELLIAGSPSLSSDVIYCHEVQNITEELNLGGVVQFIGGVSYKDIAAEYQKSNLFLNFSETGSVDKAVLEAMSCGTEVLVANEAFVKILPERNLLADVTPRTVAERIKYFMDHSEEGMGLRDIVVRDHNLPQLIKKIVAAL